MSESKVGKVDAPRPTTGAEVMQAVGMPRGHLERQMVMKSHNAAASLVALYGELLEASNRLTMQAENRAALLLEENLRRVTDLTAAESKMKLMQERLDHLEQAEAEREHARSKKPIPRRKMSSVARGGA